MNARRHIGVAVALAGAIGVVVLLAWWLEGPERAALWLSLRVAVACVAVVLGPGVLLGWWLARARLPRVVAAAADAAVNLPLVLPPVVVGFVLLAGLGRGGGVGAWLEGVLGVRVAFTWWAAVIASAVMALPLVVRSVRQAVEAVDRGAEEAAATMGAGPVAVWLTVTLPLAWPGVVSGAVLALARSLGEFGATITFAGSIEGLTRTLPAAIYAHSETPGGEAAAWRLIAASVALSVAAMLAAGVALGRDTRQGNRARATEGSVLAVRAAA